MSTSFRPYHPDQSLLLPPSPREWLPDDHLAFSCRTRWTRWTCRRFTSTTRGTVVSNVIRSLQRLLLGHPFFGASPIACAASAMTLTISTMVRSRIRNGVSKLSTEDLNKIEDSEAILRATRSTSDIGFKHIDFKWKFAIQVGLFCPKIGSAQLAGKHELPRLVSLVGWSAVH